MEILSSQSIATQTVSVQGNSAGTVRTSGASSAPAFSSSPVNRKQLEDAVGQMSEAVNTSNPPQLVFSIDESTEKTVVRITDASTGELIRQIPSEEALSIAKSLDKIQGLLLTQQA
jgi:flagellar protein FlaG